ncbi:MAG: tetratricopeptide repeat protein [Methanobacteriota archaeon]|nr:MAG: tetratricopeptide repeat protein [Euryarchaeota archaeon]
MRLLESVQDDQASVAHASSKEEKDESSPTMFLPSLEVGISNIDILRGRLAVWTLGVRAKRPTTTVLDPNVWADLLREKKDNPDSLMNEIKALLKHTNIPADMGPYVHWTVNHTDAKTVEVILKVLPFADELRDNYELSLRLANLFRLIAKSLDGREGAWIEYQRDLREGASEILEAHQSNIFGKRNLAFLCIEMGQYKEANRLLDRVLRDIKDEEALCGKAIVLRRLGKKHDALKWFENASEKNPLQPHIWRDMGDLYLELGRTEDAIDCFKEAARLKPTWGEIWEVMGYAHEEAGFEKESKECLQKASKLLPSADRRAEWAIYSAALSSGERYQPSSFPRREEPPVDDEVLKEEKERLYANQNELKELREELEAREREIATKFSELKQIEVEIAEEELQKEKVCELLSRVAAVDKENVLAFWSRGFTTIDTYRGASIEELMEAGHIKESAAKRIKKLVGKSSEAGDEEPGDEIELLEDAMVSLEDGKLEEALDSLNTITRMNPDNEEAWFDKAELFTTLGKTKEALNCYERTLEINPKNQKAWIERANLLMQEGFPVEAIKSLKRFLELDPKNANYLRERAQVYSYAGDYSNAILCYNSILQVEEDDVDAIIGLGDAMFQLSDVEEADKCFQKAIKLAPTDERAWCKRAHILNKKGRWGAAIQLYNRSIALKWNYSEPWLGKAEIHLRQGSYEDAMDSYEKAISINSSDPDAWFGKGLALEKMLSLGMAKKCFEKSLGLDENFQDAKEALKRIKEMEGMEE